MKRLMLAALAGLSCFALLATTPSANGLVIAIRPAAIPQRVARADAVVVGTVTSIEPKTVKAARYVGDTEKGDYHVAVVKVDEALMGVKGLTHIKVAFQVPMVPEIGPGPSVRPGIRPPIRRPPVQPVTLTKGQEVCLFLRQHPEESFYIAPNFDDVIDKKSPEFKAQVAEAKRYAKIMENPMVGLKSDNKEERWMTAAVLIARYRTAPQGLAADKVKQEPISAEESKLILLGLTEANWNAPRQFGSLNPQQAFFQLGLTPQDGWKQPQVGGPQFEAICKDWLKANAEKYRVKRYVAADKK